MFPDLRNGQMPLEDLVDHFNDQLYASQHLQYLQEAQVAMIEAQAIIHNMREHLAKKPTFGWTDQNDYLKALAQELSFIKAVGEIYGGEAPQMYYSQVMQHVGRALDDHQKFILGTYLDSHTDAKMRQYVQPEQFTYQEPPWWMYGPN